MEKSFFWKVLLVAAMSAPLFSCSDDDEPTLVAEVEDEVPNKLSGTRWIADSENYTKAADELSSMSIIEFSSNTKCLLYCTEGYYAESPVTWYFDSNYDEEKGSISVSEVGLTFDVIDNELFCTTEDATGATVTYKFTKDLDYVAPAKDCPLIGAWRGEYVAEGLSNQAMKWLKIIDNKRLLYYDNQVADAGHKMVLEYTFDGSTLTFFKHSNITYQLKGNKLVSDEVTLTKFSEKQ